MLNMSNSEQKNVNSENNTLIINNKNYEIDKIEICGKYNIELVTKNSNITLYLDLNKDVIASLVLNEKTNIYDKIGKDQNIKIENISYTFYIENELYITKINDNGYKIELSIPNIELLIPPFDEISKSRNDTNKSFLKNIYLNVVIELK